MLAEGETNRMAESYQQNIAAAMREEVRCVIFQPRRCRLSLPRELRYDDVLMSEGRQDVGGYLLRCLFPDQPIHCFLPRLEPAEFPLRESLQCLVEDCR